MAVGPVGHPLDPLVEVRHPSTPPEAGLVAADRARPAPVDSCLAPVAIPGSRSPSKPTDELRTAAWSSHPPEAVAGPATRLWHCLSKATRPKHRRCPMTTLPHPDVASLEFASGLIPEDEALMVGRVRAAELGCTPIGAGTGPLLRVLASSIGATNVVEIGTGAGVSSVWLLRGMAPKGILTSIDSEHDHQRAARETLQAAGIDSGRYRLIAGRAMEVLPRLTDAAYDMVFIDADKSEYPAYFEQALRLLRRGGLVIIDNALWGGKVADPAQRDPETIGLRTLAGRMAEAESLVSALVPVGDGLLVGVMAD